MRIPAQICCPAHRTPLAPIEATRDVDRSTRFLAFDCGCRFPVIGGIPRFVDSNNYAVGFGRQWKAFRRTQLDSFTGVTISRDRLARCLGGSLEIVGGKSVLEIGCGAGRFTELLLGAGAGVVAVDLSRAVEANYENCRDAPGYFVCQADLRRLPLHPEGFDIVVCLGVIQHTPDPEETMRVLCDYLKPQGLLVIDHYRYGPEDMTPVRRRLREFLILRSPWFSLLFIRALVALLWPVHRFLWIGRGHSAAAAALRQRWLTVSPVIDYHDYYSQLGSRLLYAWAALDTHDALTDRFKHKRTVEEIRDCLQESGMRDIDVHYGGNGVEARARKPPEGAEAAMSTTGPGVTREV